jgi:tetratricopeptide (TPR) repeat protein
LELAPLLPDAWLGLGIVADLEGNTKEGITLILKAAELDPENAGIYHVLAGAYEKLENDEEAIRFYQLSLNIDPKDPDCLSDYVLLLKDSSLVLALERLEQFISEHSVNAIALILKVDLLWQLQRSEEALSLFKLCLEEDRKNAQKLFEINPALKSVPEFVLLGD